MMKKRILAVALALLTLLAFASCNASQPTGDTFGVDKNKIPKISVDGFEIIVSFTTVQELTDAGFEIGYFYTDDVSDTSDEEASVPYYWYTCSMDESMEAMHYMDELDIYKGDDLYGGYVTVSNHKQSETVALKDCVIDEYYMTIYEDFADSHILIDGQTIDVNDIKASAEKLGLEKASLGFDYYKCVKLADESYYLYLKGNATYLKPGDTTIKSIELYRVLDKED